MSGVEPVVLTLSVTPTPVRRDHVWVDHGDTCTLEGRPCMICEGGVTICSVCGGAEGELLDVCPGVKLTPEQHAWNYRRECGQEQVGGR